MTPTQADIVERLRSLAAQIDPLLLGGPDARLLNEAADTISRLTADNEALAREVERLKKQIAAASTWFWPEDDTSSEACRDCPREVFEDAPPGGIAPYSCGGVVYTRWYGWLPAADDSESDDEFEVDEPTEELAQAKMRVEIDRRAALGGSDHG